MTGSRTCERKVAHPSRRSARMAARILQRKGEIAANAYYCEECSKWHVGRAGAIAQVQYQSRRSRRERKPKRERQSRRVVWQ